MSSIIRTEKVSIEPINAPSGGTGYSFKNGYPICQFLIAQSDNLLVGKSVRLSGKLNIYRDSASPPNPVNNNDGVGGVSTGAQAQNGSIDCRVGVASCIEQVTLTTLDGNQTLENVRQYPRMISGMHGAVMSPHDMTNGGSIGELTNARSVVNACSLNVTRDFCMPIRAGLLSGTGVIPLGTAGVQGMIVQLQLAPDGNVIGPWQDLGSVPPPAGAGPNPTRPTDAALIAYRNPYDTINRAGSTASTNISGYHYELSDLVLSYDLLVPDEASVQKMNAVSSGQLKYNAYSSLYSVINSSDQTVVLNLGQKQVQSVVHNIIPTTKINNSAQISTRPYRLEDAASAVADIDEVAFAKGGLLYPLEERVVVEGNPIPGVAATKLSADIIDQYLNSVKPLHTIDSTFISLLTEESKQTRIQGALPRDGLLSRRSTGDNAESNIVGGEDRWPTTGADATTSFGIGIRTDNFKVGTDYSRTPYSLRVKSKLEGDSPNSLYTYILATQTLTYSPEGIRISS